MTFIWFNFHMKGVINRINCIIYCWFSWLSLINLSTKTVEDYTDVYWILVQDYNTICLVRRGSFTQSNTLIQGRQTVKISYFER